MGIEEMAKIISKIAAGFEGACMDCLESNRGIVLQAVREQLYSGLDGEGRPLSPSYDNDDYFDEPSFWYHRSADYKAWKRSITPPISGTMLGLPPRADEVPNLFINGKFYSEINSYRQEDALIVDPGSGRGPAIVEKYGDQILAPGPTAVEFFNAKFLLPAIGSFFKDCGYQ